METTTVWSWNCLLYTSQDKKLISVHYTTMPDQDAVNMMDSSLDEFFIKALTPQELIDKVQAVLDKNNK